MSHLAKLQAQFQGYILKQQPGVEEQVVGTLKVSARQRLDIYRDAYQLRLLEVLEKDFPISRRLLGEKIFKNIVLNYIAKFPSEDFSLLRFGANFPVYLKEIDQKISEVSQVERLLDEILDEKDSEALSINQLQEIAQANLAEQVFLLVPSSRLLRLSSNAIQLWQANFNGQPLPKLEAIAPVYFVSYRNNLMPKFKSLSALEFNMLNLLSKNLSFAEICEALAELMPASEVAVFAVQCLQQWTLDGLLCSEK